LETIPSIVGLHVSAFARTTSEDLHAVVRQASAMSVAVQELAPFLFDGPPGPRLVFGYGAIPIPQIAEGMRRLTTCFEGTAGIGLLQEPRSVVSEPACLSDPGRLVEGH